MRILDAVAISPTTPFTTTGYEIKVSRQDFKQDSKWGDYLTLVNRLFIACPTGLIQPNELDLQVGLVYCSKDATRVVRRPALAPGHSIEMILGIITAGGCQEANEIAKRRRLIDAQMRLHNGADGHTLAMLLNTMTRKRLWAAEEKARAAGWLLEAAARAGIGPDADLCGIVEELADLRQDRGKAACHVADQLDGLARRLRKQADGV